MFCKLNEDSLKGWSGDGEILDSRVFLERADNVEQGAKSTNRLQGHCLFHFEEWLHNLNSWAHVDLISDHWSRTAVSDEGWIGAQGKDSKSEKVLVDHFFQILNDCWESSTQLRAVVVAEIR